MNWPEAEFHKWVVANVQPFLAVTRKPQREQLIAMLQSIGYRRYGEVRPEHYALCVAKTMEIINAHNAAGKAGAGAITEGTAEPSPPETA